MNSVALTGRLTKDPDVRYGGANQTAVARFTLAVDRSYASKDAAQTADFIGIVCFGKTAELVEKYVGKGRLIGITGRIQTGSYEKDGRKVYTTDIVADRVEFLGSSGNSEGSGSARRESAPQVTRESEIPDGFTQMTDDDIPF